MTDREKELIAAYIPTPRDTTLGDFEYYAKDMNGRIQKVEIASIFPSDDDKTLYGVVLVNSRRRLKGWYKYDGFRLSDLYDNKQDCKDDTHYMYDYWEKLREIQQREAAL